MQNSLENNDSDSRPRNIHRTVKFLGKLDDKRDQEKINQQLINYKWMNGTVYLIIAIPRLLRNSNNEDLYIDILTTI